MAAVVDQFEDEWVGDRIGQVGHDLQSSAAPPFEFVKIGLEDVLMEQGVHCPAGRVPVHGT